MTLKDLKEKIYDIIDNGDQLMTTQEKTDYIMVEILTWHDGCGKDNS